MHQPDRHLAGRPQTRRDDLGVDGRLGQAVEELAMLAGLSASSANAHLARLAAGGLLRIEARGRKRFFRMAAADVSAAVDALASTTMASVARSAVGLPVAALLAPSSLRQARLCHDHLGVKWRQHSINAWCWRSGLNASNSGFT